LAQHTLLF
jgi:hypothetical protein